jgi:hypothetical protein
MGSAPLAAQRSLPIADVIVDDLEVAPLAPTDLEDLLTVDADPKARKFFRPSIGLKRSGRFDRDAAHFILADYMRLRH